MLSTGQDKLQGLIHEHQQHFFTIIVTLWVFYHVLCLSHMSRAQSSRLQNGRTGLYP